MSSPLANPQLPPGGRAVTPPGTEVIALPRSLAASKPGLFHLLL